MLIAVATFGGTAFASDAGDPERGRKVFKKCSACHMVGPEARNRVGPLLNNIMLADAAAVEGFKYSKAMKQAAEDGLQWTPEALDEFLESPRTSVPKTKMSFRGLKKEADRADLIAFLATYSDDEPDDEAAVPVDAGFTVSAEILGLEGDIEYGEYLASECTTCHQTTGDNDGIPGIVGWPVEDFVTAMHAYREKHRENPVMQMVTGRLDNEEIAALATYFNSLED